MDQLLELLRNPQPQGEVLRPLIIALEQNHPCDLTNQAPQLEGVWELRWSSSKLPYLQVQPWLENLQLLLPRERRAMNLLRLVGPGGGLGTIAVLAELQLEPPQRVGVRFVKGGWLGPRLGPIQAQLMPAVNQSFPAWLDITFLSEHLRICRGNNGTLFALLKRPDLDPHALWPSNGGKA
ncbi:MAG: hypothetical protein RLZZ158_109 [Cyanobacteriota bacterium]|jgi:hypothetical protein